MWGRLSLFVVGPSIREAKKRGHQFNVKNCAVTHFLIWLPFSKLGQSCSCKFTQQQLQTPQYALAWLESDTAAPNANILVMTSCRVNEGKGPSWIFPFQCILYSSINTNDFPTVL